MHLKAIKYTVRRKLNAEHKTRHVHSLKALVGLKEDDDVSFESKAMNYESNVEAKLAINVKEVMQAI